MNSKCMKMFAISLGLYACGNDEEKVKEDNQPKPISSYGDVNSEVDAEMCRSKCKDELAGCLSSALANNNVSRRTICQRRYGEFADASYCFESKEISQWREDCLRDNRGTCLNKCYERQQQIIDYQKAVGTYKEPTTVVQ